MGETGIFTVDSSNPLVEGTGPYKAGRVAVDCTIASITRPGASGATIVGDTYLQGYEILGPISALALTSGKVDLIK